MSGWGRSITVQSVSTPIEFYLSPDSAAGNLVISNVKVYNVQTPTAVYGNLELATPIGATNIVVSNVAAPMRVYGNVGLSNGGSLSADAVVSRVVAPVQAYGNVGISSDAALTAAVSNVASSVQVYGNVTLTGNFTPTLTVSSISSAAYVYGNVGIAANASAPNATVTSVVAPVGIYGNVGLAGASPTLAVSNVSAPTKIYGNASLVSGVSMANAISVTGVADRVEVFGNVTISAPTQAAEATVSSFAAPVQVRGNVDGTLYLGSVVVGRVAAPVSVSGNVFASSGLYVSNEFAATFDNPVGVAGNVGFDPSAVASNAVVSSVAASMDVYGTVGFSFGAGVYATANASSTTAITGDATLSNYADATGRLSVSRPVALLEAKFTGDNGDSRTTSSNSGSGFVSYDPERPSMTIGTTSGVGNAIIQTRQRAVYQTGRALVAAVGFDFCTPIADVVQRVGYFDTSNGVFLQSDSSNVSIVLRSTASGAVADAVVPRTSWNVDPLDGTGRSGLAANVYEPQVFFCDIAYLGVGMIRAGFFIDGSGYVAHIFRSTDGPAYSPIVGNPNLPVRWETTSSVGASATANLEAFGCSVISDGGYDYRGFFQRSVEASASVAPYEVREMIAVRVISGFESFASAYVKRVSLLVRTGVCWRVILNATVSSPGAWTNIASDGSSFVEYNTTRTSVADTGREVASGYLGASSESQPFDISEALSGMDIEGNADVISLEITGYSDTTDYWFVTMELQEIY